MSNLEAATFLFVNQLFVCVLFCLCLLVLFVLLVSWFLSLASFVGQLVGCWFATRQQGSAVHCSVQMHEMPGFLDILEIGDFGGSRGGCATYEALLSRLLYSLIDALL